METELNFAHNLVKGKIAETVFAQMFRRTRRYTVLEFGYEKVVPELVQRGIRDNDGVMEALKTAPDFAVIDLQLKYVKLVEVKYRKQCNKLDILTIAKRMREAWNPSYLFIATLEGFYMDSVDTVVRREGNMNLLTFDVIPESVQKQYLKILKDFEDGK